MKKTVFTIILLLLVLISASACSKAETSGEAATKNDTLYEAAVAGQQAKIDVDLTRLSSTMVYSKVYDMLDNPESYIGKTVKMKGSFAAYKGELRDYYFACVIADATACCQQGMEFRLKDDPAYPQGYPEEGKTITVTGTFSTYMEGEAKYIELKDCTLES